MMSIDAARQLTILAREILSSDSVIESDIVSWELEFAEGPVDDSDRVVGKKGKTIKEMSRLLKRYPKPARGEGYNKIYFDVKFVDGDKLSFKYYHSETDPGVEVQAKRWLSTLSR